MQVQVKGGVERQRVAPAVSQQAVQTIPPIEDILIISPTIQKIQKTTLFVTVIRKPNFLQSEKKAKIKVPVLFIALKIMFFENSMSRIFVKVAPKTRLRAQFFL